MKGILVAVVAALGLAIPASAAEPLMPAPFFDLVCAGATISCTLLSPTFSGTATFTGPLLLPDGSATNPSWGWKSDNDGTGTGAFRSTTDEITFVTNGTQTWQLGSSSVKPLRPAIDNVYDMGQSNLRPRDGYFARAFQGSTPKSLTSAAAAVAVMSVTVPSNGYAGGEMVWNATETNATEFQSLAGRIRFACVNKAGTLTSAINVVGTDLLAQSSASTFTCTWTNVTGAGVCNLSATCTTGLASPGAISMNYRLDMPLPNTLAAQ